MKKLVLTLFVLPLFLFAETSIWKVQKNGNTVYIGGTIHLLRAGDYPLPKEYDKAYNLSQELYFETNISAMNEQQTQQLMFKMMLLDNGQTLSTVLSKSTYEKLEAYTNKYGIRLKDFKAFKPAMPALMITIAELKSIGVTMQGIDTFYENKALQDNKKVGELESVQKHLEYISSIGEGGNENQMIEQSIKDLEKIKILFPQMIQAWRRGDEKKMADFFVADMKRDYPNLYDTLLVERNNNWLPKIKSMFKSKDVEFVLVGTAHLVGSDGIIEKLKKDGFKVEKFK